MKNTIRIVMECDSDMVGEVLAAANLACKKHGKECLVTAVEEKRGA